MRSRLAWPLLLAAFSVAASAQTPTAPLRAVGLVRDSAGTPIADADVSSSSARVRTDSLGRFSLRVSKTDSTTITVKRLGFESVTFTVSTDTLTRNDLAIELQAIVRSLPNVSVSEVRYARVPTIEGFEQRRRTKGGLGFFVSRADLVEREGQRLSNILRTARGVRIIRGSHDKNLLRFARWTSKGASCAPHMWLDGVRVQGLEVDDISTVDVEAIELYPNSSSAPSEFNAGSAFACGLVAIWTRRPILRSR